MKLKDGQTRHRVIALVSTAMIGIVIIAGAVYAMAVSVNNNASLKTVGQLLGGDRDAHGCIGSAGYSWCALKNKCLRIWEEACDNKAVTAKPALSVILKNLLATKTAKPVSDISLTIASQDLSHASGSFKTSKNNDAVGAYFLATKIIDDWQIVASGNGQVDCPKMKNYGFSSTMLKNYCD